MSDKQRLAPVISGVLCPRCAVHMRLAAIEPDEPKYLLERFQCVCGFEYSARIDVATLLAPRDAYGADEDRNVQRQ